MSFAVVAAGPVVSVQDPGRRGMSAFGVSFAGPMDPPALALANALVGNPPAAAVLEFAGFGGSFRAGRRLRIALAGAAAEARIGARRLDPLCAHWLEPDEVLHVGGVRAGVWGYLAVSGGIATPPVMGSRSTHLRFALGGLDGRVLRAGDVLPLGEDSGAPCLRLPPAAAAAAPAGPIRAVPGPQDDLFDEASRAAFFGGAAWQVSPRCDRMAMALAGPPLCAPGGHDIVSDGIVPGSVQVPGNGQPLVLMAESQTTGGYPKIATVIGADLPRLAQSPPGTAIRFQPVTQAEAEDLWRAHRQALERRLAALVPVAPAVLHSAFLLSVNLIGGTWPAAAEADGP